MSNITIRLDFNALTMLRWLIVRQCDRYVAEGVQPQNVCHVLLFEFMSRQAKAFDRYSFKPPHRSISPTRAQAMAIAELIETSEISGEQGYVLRGIAEQIERQLMQTAHIHNPVKKLAI